MTVQAKIKTSVLSGAKLISETRNLKPKASFIGTLGYLCSRLWEGGKNSVGSRCLGCGLVLAASEFRSGLCCSCEAALSPRKGGFCPSCGKLAANGHEMPALCGECRQAPRPWEGFAFHSSYDGLLRELLLQFKFHSGFGTTRLLQQLCREAYDRHLNHWGGDVIVPVPMHESRLRERGFNQSVELARGLRKSLRAPLAPGALQRTRPTRFQSGLTRKHRRKNLSGALLGDPALVSKRKVLLVDDIMTTGATLTACTRALMSAGASSVSVLVLGRVPEPGT